MERLRTFGPVKSVRQEKQIADDGNEVMVGIVEGYLSTWDVDRAGDRFVKGAFKECIENLRKRQRPMRLKRNHFGDLIGGFDPEKLAEDEIGLYGVAEINLLVQEGREAYALAKQGVLSDFSVGVSIKPEDIEQDDDERRFMKATVWETSLVDEPMNERAVVTAVRAYKDAMTTPDEVVVACARYVLSRDTVDESERPDIESAINERYTESVGRESPLVRGTWSVRDLEALPKSLRGSILKSERLSAQAIEAVCHAFQPETHDDEADEFGRLITEALEHMRLADEQKSTGELISILQGVNQ